MTREELREQLARLADSAPVAEVPDDTFARGRRAVVRARVAGAVVGVACLVAASVLGGLALGHRSTTAQVADPSPSGEGLGVPDHVWAPPHSIAASDSLAVGRAAAAFVDERFQVVVVGASDGRYQRLDTDSSDAQGAVGIAALSPDGRHLATSRVTERSDGGYGSDLALIDLVSGEEKVVPAAGRQRVNLTDLVWSPNGRWIGWQAFRMCHWTDRDYRPCGARLGGVVSATGRAGKVSTLLPHSAEGVTTGGTTTYDTSRPGPIAVSDSGHLAAVAGVTLWRDGEHSRLKLPATEEVGGLWFTGDAVFDVQYPAQRGTPVSLGPVTSPASRSSVAGVTLPRYLGTMPGGQVLLQHDGTREQHEDATTVVAVPQHLGVALGDRPLITVAPDIVKLSIATDLMPADHPTVHRGEPDWPWSTGQKAAAYAGVGVAVLLLLGLGAWAWRRRAP